MGAYKHWAKGTAVRGFAACLLAMLPTVSFSASHTAPENTGTAEETTKLAAAAGKYEIAGMKLGTPLNEAMQALKAHNPKLQLKVETTQDRFDTISEHSRKEIPVPDAVAQASKETYSSQAVITPAAVSPPATESEKRTAPKF